MASGDVVTLALDIGGTKVAGAVVALGEATDALAPGTVGPDGDGRARLLHRVQVPTPATAGPEAVMDALLSVAGRLRERCPDSAAVGVGSAGQIDSTTGVVLYANENLPGWTGMDIRGRVAAALRLPVAVDNDVNTMALGEATYGVGAGRRVVVVVAVGTGIGGGLVFDGQLFHGASGVAGEIGHIPLTAGGPLCVCGRRGCLEAYAAGPRIAAEYGRAAGLRGPIALPEVVERAGAGDRLARLTLTRAGRRIGQVLAGVVNTLNPDAIVLGGGAVGAGEWLVAPLRRDLARRALAPSAQAVAVLPATLGADAGLYGAAVLALGVLREPPGTRADRPIGVVHRPGASPPYNVAPSIPSPPPPSASRP